jgi:hypothetical protein
MPLIHSRRPSAFKKNVKTEVEAGKPVKQALAIAYDTSRNAGGMDPSDQDDAVMEAEGGEVDQPDQPAEQEDVDSELHDQVGQELMDAIHSKNKKGIVESLRAMILTMNSDKEQE